MANEKNSGGGGSEFDRDFGYLMPFLDKVAASASSLSGPARAELESLVSGEKARWARIRELLSGKSASPRRSADADLTGRTPGSGSGSGSGLGAAAAPPSLDGRAFTVGALRKR